jgi:hypothetical protein
LSCGISGEIGIISLISSQRIPDPKKQRNQRSSESGSAGGVSASLSDAFRKSCHENTRPNNECDKINGEVYDSAFTGFMGGIVIHLVFHSSVIWEYLKIGK